MHDSRQQMIEDRYIDRYKIEDTRRNRSIHDDVNAWELVLFCFLDRGLSVVDILEFCLLLVGNLTSRGSLSHGRKLLLPLLQDGGDSTRGVFKRMLMRKRGVSSPSMKSMSC